MVRVLESCLEVSLIHTLVLYSLKHWQFVVVVFYVCILMSIPKLNNSIIIQKGDHTYILFSTSTNQLIKVSW